MGLLRLAIFSLAWLHHIGKGQNTNLPPLFIKDMNNVVLPESISVGQVVYTLEGTDPEGSPVVYGLAGTDKFTVNPSTGEVTLVQPLDREVNDTLKFLVSIEDKVDGPGTNNLVQVPVSVIVLDENDNAPTFKNGPYEADVPENEAVGTTILRDILVEDKDSFGDTLEVGCSSNLQWPDACSVFRVVATQASQSQYQGALVLNAPLDYNHKQFYQFYLFATDGVLNSTTSVEIRVKDIQNLPPMFVSSLAAVLPEDSPIGTLALTVQARDGDRAQPRNISYDLLTNPLDFFLLDSQTGELKTAKPLDREALPDPSAPLNLTVRAREIVDGQPVDSDMTTTLATLTVTIRDVNDEPPRFNRREYSVDIPENIAAGTPLPNLDMVVTDPDVGTNSTFSLRLSDVSGAFSVEPSQATGSTQVTIRLNNNTLDYENPNQRKFIILVIAEELHTNPRLSSTATVTVTVSDVNDNAPKFQDEAYSATVSETAPAGTHVTTIVAHDVDHARFGSEGIVYQMFGNGVDLFKVDNRTGMISVVGCETPGAAPCLDYETKQDYFLNYRATDDDGSGQTNMVSLKISVTDANDNPPIFDAVIYRASIDEDATKFEPELQVQARDADKTSEIRYSILDTMENSPFLIDSVNGKIRIKPGHSLETENKNNFIVLRILATDGVHNATCEVHITVRDVNNHAPVFDSPSYKATIVENEPIGTEVGTVSATDQDSGVNAEIKYFVQKGALDSFTIDNVTGQVTVASKLDYDKRNTYHIQIIAADQGTPSLTGTTTLTVSISNANDKSPSFTPQIQRAEVSADADVGTLIHNLIAKDPDILSNEDLKFELGSQSLKAVNKNGKVVEDNSVIASWFTVSPDGRVSVAHKLDRNVAAVVTLPVIVEDTTAPTLQQADGELIISIVDVNRHPPVFSQSHYSERLMEEQPTNTVLGTYEATDKDSAISHYAIEPPSKYFKIDNVTGTVRSTQRIDYERVRRIDFNVVAYDAGAPQLSATASVAVDVVNVNDEEPHFDEKVEYEAAVKENSLAGTPLLFVHASDADEGQYGEVRYSLTGEHADMFTMDPETGEVKVAEGADIDRETTADIWLQAIASDNAPPNTRKTASIPIHIKVLDENDNEPSFIQKVYKNTIAENLQLNPPAPILQVRAEDKDVGKNGEVKYAIVEQTVPGAFQLNAGTGILFPAAPMVGNTTHHLRISATDGAGSGPHTVLAEVDIDVKSVNQHKPTFVTPAATQTAIEIPENAAQADLLVMTVKAVDPDSGENGRISYFLKVANQNVHETADFTLDEYTGELRTKNFLDREQRDSYSLVLVATDNGMPAPFEVIHFLNVVLKDSNDNKPQFPKELYEFTISENQPVGIIIGTVRAMDKDSGENGKVYYHVVQGNRNGAFTLDKTQGILKTNMSFDREVQSEYMLTVYASNNPILDGQTDELNSIEDAQQDVLNGTLSYKTEREKIVTHIVVRILDENDNEPKFEKAIYFAGIKYTAKVNELILPVQATDPDFEANGTISYLVAASNLYKFGSQQSSGSIVPSPFNITQDGLLLTANFMAEYNQDRFVLQLIAQETEPPHRQAKAQVYLWIVSVEQLVRVVLSRPCGVAERSRGELEQRLSEATNSIMVVSAVKHYVHTARLYEDWCEIHLHAVDPTTYAVLPVDKVLELIDTQYDGLKDLYQESGIETVIAASASGKVRESFDPALAALIALLIVLFTGIVTFIVVCSCLKHWVIAPPSMESSKGDSLARRRILEELSTTENPLWLENKLRPYEEQELTMNVFGEQNEAGQTPAGNNDQLPPVDNTYATIQGGGGEREYATLPNRSAAARSESPTPLEAMLGFQGSTFQPPMAPDTPEPPPRPSIGLNHHVVNI